MLFKHPGSRARYREYLERRKDPNWSKMDKESVRAAESARRADAGRPGRKGVAAPPARSRSFGALFVEFWRQIEGGHRLLFMALATLTLSTAVALIVPTSTKIAIDYVLTDHPGPTGLPLWVIERFGHDAVVTPADRKQLLWALGAAMITVSALSVGIGTWGRWQTTRLTKRTQAAMRRRAFEHAVQLPLHTLHQFRSGGVVGILREDAGQAAELVFSMIYNPWRAVVQLTGTLVILTFVDWRMLLGAMILIPATWLTHRTWINRIRPIFRDIKVTRTGIDAHTTEAFGGMRVVRGFARQLGETARFTHAGHYMTRQEILVWWASRVLEIIWAILIPVASVGVLLYGGSRVIDGRLSIGDVMMFSTYLLMLLSPLETLTNTAASIQSNLAGFDRVLDVLSEPREFEGARGEFVVGRHEARGAITLRDVTFAYPPAPRPKHRAEPAAGSPVSEAPHVPTPVLVDISLDVRPGETIALVGPSGSGKTTLCNLVARFHDPTRGTVSLDGRDLRSIELSSFRRLLGIVEQDVFLFDGSIAENIAYARRDATMEQIIEAARAANAHEFIQKLEFGYDTLIGERGVRLSGGQKQRLAIARAVLAAPLILILDEATSNLDSESEALIQKSLARLMRGRTSFVIAHRLSTIRHADRIVVLEGGRIAEVGSHKELMEHSGRYSQLLRTQVEGLVTASDAEAGPRPAMPAAGGN